MPAVVRTPKTRSLVRTVAAFVLSGLTNREIADVLRCTEDYISALRQSDFFVERMDELAKTMESQGIKTARILQKHAPAAAEVLTAIVKTVPDGNNGITHRLRLDAAKDLLDRTGHKAVEHVITEHEERLVIVRDAHEIDAEATEMEDVEEDLESAHISVKQIPAETS